MCRCQLWQDRRQWLPQAGHSLGVQSPQPRQHPRVLGEVGVQALKPLRGRLGLPQEVQHCANLQAGSLPRLKLGQGQRLCQLMQVCKCQSLQQWSPAAQCCAGFRCSRHIFNVVFRGCFRSLRQPLLRHASSMLLGPPCTLPCNAPFSSTEQGLPCFPSQGVCRHGPRASAFGWRAPARSGLQASAT